VKAIGYVRVSTKKQADFGVSLEAQSEKVRATAVVQGVELAELIIDAGESAKSLNRPGMARLLFLVDASAMDTVIIAKLDLLTRRGLSLVSVAESLDTGTAEQGILSRIRGLKAARFTTRQIADELNRKATPPSAGRHGGFSMWRKHSGRHEVLSARCEKEAFGLH
jgi:DNA invertase Pin-like site-specific DNA recombinase